MIEDDLTTMLVDQARAVGRQFARKYPGQEADDIAADVACYALENWDRLSRAMDRADEYGKQPQDTLRFWLAQRASQYCGAQHYSYILGTAQVIYTPKEVRALLSGLYYDPAAWDTPSKDSEYGGNVEYRSVYANLTDIKAALGRVTNKVHNIIFAAFGPADLDLPQPDKRRVSEAIDKLTRELNRHLYSKETS